MKNRNQTELQGRLSDVSWVIIEEKLAACPCRGSFPTKRFATF